MAVTSILETVFRRRKKKSTEFISILVSLKDSAVFEFDFDSIRAATNEFSDLLGRSRYYSVYKGRLQCGQQIAVKILPQSPKRQFRNECFQNELNIMSKLRHKNLINLLGFCIKRDQKCLVYEFMPDPCLDCYIYDPLRASQLSWEMCRNIIEGIARGLRYLHEESGLWVIHLDIKPQIIFLDSDLKPKIAGFELARLLKQGETEAETTSLVGTIGYIAPEYHQTLRFSVKTDIYAFGVTILTIISRRKVWSVGEDPLLIEYVTECWNRGEAIDVIHENMREEEREDSISEILRYIHIALLCINENAETRPSIDKVMHWFSCFSTALPEPGNGDRFLAEEETNWSLLTSPSPGHSSVMSPISSR